MTRAPRASRGFGQRIAHLAAGAVGDVAHRVERLLRGPGGDQEGFALEVPSRCRRLGHRFDDVVRLGQRPGPIVPQARKPSSGSTIT